MALPYQIGLPSSLAGALRDAHKLSPPLAEGLVRRDRLLNLINEAPDAGVISIVAPPLSGKSSLAATWLQANWVKERSGLGVWYQVDDTDMDIAEFFRLIRSATSAGEDSHSFLPAYSPEALKNIRTFARLWFRALLKHRA